MTCERITSGLSGLCACGSPLDGDCHVIRDLGKVSDLCCRECCRCCSPVFTEFAGKAVTVSGEQELLWK